MNVYVVEYSACIAVDSSLHSVEKERQNYTIGVFSSILKAKSAVLNFVEGTSKNILSLVVRKSPTGESTHYFSLC